MNTTIKKIAYLIFGNGAIALSNIVSFAIASRYLLREDYATFRQTFLPYDVLIPVLSLGIPSAIYYLLPRSKDKLNLFIESLLILLFMSLVFSCFILFGGSEFLSIKFNNVNLDQTLKWVTFYAVFQLPVMLFVSILVYENKTKLLGVFSSVNSVLGCVVIAVLSIKFGGFKEIVIFKSLYPILGFLLLLFIIVRYYLKNSVFNLEGFGNFSSILVVSVPLGVASMVGAVSQQLDKILVSYLSTPQLFAVYVNGAIEIPLIAVITGSISSVLLGSMSQSVKDGDLVKACSYFRATASKSALILFPVMIFLLINSREFIVLIFSKTYMQSATTFKIYLLLLPIRIVVFGSALIALGKGKVILFRSVVELLINCILSIILFRFYGVNGVAIGTVVVVYLWSVPYNIYEICKGFNSSVKRLFEYRLLFKIMFFSMVFSPVLYFMKYINFPTVTNLFISFFAYFSLVFIAFKKLNLISANFEVN